MARRRTTRLTVLGLLIATATAAVAAPSPELLEVRPAAAGEQLVCRLQSRGLPGDRLLQSMRSGLVSAVDLQLVLFDDESNAVREHGLRLRLAFDIWDEVFSVTGVGTPRRFADLEAIEGFLAELPPLPVAPLALLAEGDRYRIDVALRLHAIAPSEHERVEEVISGRERGLADRQEVSVGIDRLIRFFYDDDGDDDIDDRAESAWFRREELSDAAD